jgi:hypothetical protein
VNAIRCTIYASTPEGTPDSYRPFTSVILERDLREDLSLSEATMQFVELADEQGTFCVTETFDVPDRTTIEAASFRAIEQMQPREQAERYMACLYQYEAQAFAHTRPHTVLMGTIMAPMSVEDCASTMRRLARHPDYKGQRVLMPTQDGHVVTLDDGEVSFEKVDP